MLAIGRLGEWVRAGHADSEEEDDHESNGDGHGVHVDEFFGVFLKVKKSEKHDSPFIFCKIT